MKYLSLCVCVAFSISVFSQSSKVTSANNYLGQGELVKAKKNIDEASVHPKSSKQAKTWAYKGKIYYQIAIDTTAELADARKDAIYVSVNSFTKVIEEPDSRVNIDETKLYLFQYVYNKLWNDAIFNYNNHLYEKASLAFYTCGDVRKLDNILDTTAYYYAANSASLAGLHEKSILYYDEIRESGYQNGSIYSKLMAEYKLISDTAKSIEVLQEGRLAFPDNEDLLIQEFYTYIESNQTEKAFDDINKAISLNPNKASYFFVRGKLKSVKLDYQGAESDYLQCLKLDPKYYDANYDLGVLYINESVEIKDEIDNLPFDSKGRYEILSAKLDSLYVIATPYFLATYNLDVSNLEVKSLLKKLYLYLKDTQGYDMIVTQDKLYDLSVIESPEIRTMIGQYHLAYANGDIEDACNFIQQISQAFLDIEE